LYSIDRKVALNAGVRELMTPLKPLFVDPNLFFDESYKGNPEEFEFPLDDDEEEIGGGEGEEGEEEEEEEEEEEGEEGFVEEVEEDFDFDEDSMDTSS